MKNLLRLLLMMMLPFTAIAADKVVNIYAWTGEIPDFIVRQFEKETGIKVNISTYENNEIMYAKIRASQQAGYDLIMPTSYFIDRMSHQNLLEKLDKSKLSNWKNLNPDFLHPNYDPNTEYSVPFIWGITGIFVNKEYFSPQSINKWSDLWDKRFYNKLMLTDDIREVFSMALLAMGYSVNDSDPEHIKAAFLKLKPLMDNVKVFSTDTVVSIIIDEDVTAGMAWNGDVFKASKENNHVQFIFPQEGFIIWVDNIAIPKNAPHKEAAYTFINFILRPEVARDIALYTRFPVTNLAAQKLLPTEIRNNPVIYPPKEIVQRGQFLVDLGDETLKLYERYWEELKMSS